MPHSHSLLLGVPRSQIQDHPLPPTPHPRPSPYPKSTQNKKPLSFPISLCFPKPKKNLLPPLDLPKHYVYTYKSLPPKCLDFFCRPRIIHSHFWFPALLHRFSSYGNLRELSTEWYSPPARAERDSEWGEIWVNNFKYYPPHNHPKPGYFV